MNLSSVIAGRWISGEEADTMLMQEYIEEAEKALLHTYNRYQVVLEKGEGVYLYDMEGKKYLDFVSGIAVFALGYGNREYNDALKAQIDKITEAFYMVDKSRSREQGGAGLGLAICLQIVQLHEGSMQFESEEGKGTRVTLRLRLAEKLA